MDRVPVQLLRAVSQSVGGSSISRSYSVLTGMLHNMHNMHNSSMAIASLLPFGLEGKGLLLLLWKSVVF